MRTYVLAFIAWFFLLGCGNEGPPPPLALDQVPSALTKAFSSGPSERKELADRAISALQNKEVGKALMVVEGLARVPDLNKEQRAVVSRVLLTLNQELQAAEARGDKEAAEVLRTRQMTR
jgi:RNA polymerase-interacting CarD/CdnL/TRCF family regulator